MTWVEISRLTDLDTQAPQILLSFDFSFVNMVKFLQVPHSIYLKIKQDNVHYKNTIVPYNIKSEEKKISYWYNYHIRMIKMIYTKRDYLCNQCTDIRLYILVVIMNLVIFFNLFTCSADIYSELIMDQKPLGTWNIILKKIKFPTSRFHYVISGTINSKHRNVTCHMVMRAFQNIKAPKRGLEGESIGNIILFGTVSKES